MSNDILEDKYKMHEECCNKLNPIYRSKNTDYDDSFSKNIDSMGYISAIVRMDDKMNRLKALLLNPENVPKVKDESIADTLMDLANYALMLSVEYQLRNK